jgi:hypothetical protein
MTRRAIGLIFTIAALLILAVAMTTEADEGQERICFYCRDHSEFVWGGDLYFFSDESSTQKLKIEGSTGDIDSEGDADFAGALTVGGAFNPSGAVDIDSTLNVDGAASLNSTLDVDGNITSGTGAITMTDNLVVDGAADVVQLTVQGHTTQTSSLLVLEQSDGTDKLTVSDDGNLVVAGTSDLQGNVSDSGGVLTVADNAIVDGQADAVQLTAQGYTTQTNDIFVVESSGGTNLLDVDNSGNTYVAGDLNYDITATKATTNTAITDAGSGSLYLNMGATSEITLTLPSAVAGTHYCFYVSDAFTMTIAPDGADQVHHLTNSAGDRLQNDGTAGDSVCLAAVDDTYWVPLQEVGTWSDAD